MTRRGVEAIGLKLFVDRQYTWGLTSLELPQEIDAGKLLELAESEYRVTMAGGQDQLKGRLVRIGHMGYVDFADILAGLYALERGVTKLGGGPAARPDYLEQAMQAFEDPGYPEGDCKNKMERPFVAEDT
jgi:aspartate aminotransferase-like enzyme